MLYKYIVIQVFSGQYECYISASHLHTYLLALIKSNLVIKKLESIYFELTENKTEIKEGLEIITI